MLKSTEVEGVSEFNLGKLASHIGQCKYFDLVYNRLNARAYIDHREEDFAVQIRTDGICTYIQLFSKKEQRVLEWILCDVDHQHELNNR